MTFLKNDHLLRRVNLFGANRRHGPRASPADDQNVCLNVGLSEFHKNLPGKSA
jgi:hypothetical protein